MDINIEKEIISQAKQDGVERFVVGGVVLNENNEFLLLNRNSDDFMGGIDELPSGKVEQEDKSLVQALEREVLEETGLKVNEVVDYIGYFDYTSGSGKKTRQFNFVVMVENYDVKTSPEEHSGYIWASKTNLDKTKLTKNVLDLLKKIWKELWNALLLSRKRLDGVKWQNKKC